MTTTRLPKHEVGERGRRIYQSRLPGLLEAGLKGLFVAIDVVSEECEVAEEARDAGERLRAKHPDAQVLVERIGYPAAFSALGLRSRR